MLSLALLLIPALGLPVALLLLGGRPGIPPLLEPAGWPWQLWLLVIAGSTATVCGWLDHRYHSVGGRPISRKERRSEWAALGVGSGVFVLMSCASVSSQPLTYLIPVIVLVVGATALICYDEFFFHRSCTRYETLLHRGLVFGNGTAWLSWSHWCFVAGGAS